MAHIDSNRIPGLPKKAAVLRLRMLGRSENQIPITLT